MQRVADPGVARAEIYEVFADHGADFGDRIDRVLAVGTDYLDVPIGFLTEIDDGTQTIAAATGSHDLIQAGEACPLDRAYCRRTVEREGVLAVGDAAAASEVSERAVDAFGLATYIGAKVVVDGEVYGTVCFADTDPRDADFSEREELFVELVARLTGRALERREHERELEARNATLEAEKRRFEGIAAASFDVQFRVDDEGTFTYVSPAVERVLGYEPAALVGEPFAAFVAEESVEAATAAYRRSVEGQPVEGLELAFVTADGGRAVLEVNARPVAAATASGSGVGARAPGSGGEAGRPASDAGAVVQGVGRDVTARKEREAELRRKNRAIDDADVGITIVDATDPTLPITFANEAFERITGYPRSAVRGRNCRFLQGEATDEDTVRSIRDGLAARDPVSVELVNYRRDGTPFWNDLTITPVEGAAGEVTDFVGFQRDVTERKREEKLLDVLNRVLRHNLRNDMSAVLGYSELVEQGGDVDVPLGERITDIAEGLVALGETAHRLERLARCEPTPRRLDPETLLSAVVDGYRADPAVDITVDVRADCAVCAGGELEHAVAELVENAVVHAGAEPSRIRLALRRDGEWVELDVADDGPGIGDAEAATATRAEESPLEHGSGLGLWLVNWIVTRYGGSFAVRSLDAAGGTLATVRLPAIDADTSVDDVARRPTTLFW